MWAGNIGSQGPADIHQNIIYILYVVQKQTKERMLITLKKDELFKRLYFIIHDFNDEFCDDVEIEKFDKMIDFLCDRLESDLELEDKFFED